MAVAKKKVLKYSKMADVVNDMAGYATAGSAGIDIACGATAVTIKSYKTEKVRTGIKVAIPKGYVGVLTSRSGLGVDGGLTVAQGVGIIDSDYRGELKVPLYNRDNQTHRVLFGEKIAQLVLIPVAQADIIQVEALDETERGEGGFGSTGV